MNTIPFLAGLLICAGCTQDVPDTSRQTARPQNYQAFTQAVVRGMPAEELRRSFGPPLSSVELAPGLTAWDYEFADPGPGRDQPVEAMVTIRSNRVEHVSLVTRLTSPQEKTSLTSADRDRQPSILKLWRALPPEVPGATEFHSDALGRKWVGKSPEISFTNLARVESYEGRGQTQFSVVFELLPQDARLLADFTSTNVGDEVIITIDTIPIAAVEVVTPINQGIFEVGVKGRELHSNIIQRARTMVSRDQ